VDKFTILTKPLLATSAREDLCAWVNDLENQSGVAELVTLTRLQAD
jgi:hypothetical protein